MSEEEKNKIMIKALRKIVDCNQSDVVKYIQYVDSVALDALIAVEEC